MKIIVDIVDMQQLIIVRFEFMKIFESLKLFNIIALSNSRFYYYKSIMGQIWYTPLFTDGSQEFFSPRVFPSVTKGLLFAPSFTPYIGISFLLNNYAQNGG